MTFVLGMDIGYSNVKLTFGRADTEQPDSVVMPSGAAPLDQMNMALDGTGSSSDYTCVTVDDEKWVAGVSNGLIAGDNRQLHKNYSTTDNYRALFYAALHTAAMKGDSLVIDRLVTGLPVDQHQQDTYRDSLAARLTGKHQISPLMEVEVKQTIVLPQPAGAYLDIGRTLNADSMRDAVVLVIDPGFFSVDFVVMAEGRIRQQSSGTSKKAMSVLIETIDGMVRKDLGRSIGQSRIENALRTGELELKIGPVSLDLSPYVPKASEVVAPVALSQMQSQMRHEDIHPDFVVMAGGGSQHFTAAAKSVFPNVEVMCSDDPVLANSRGFFLYGASV